MRSRSLGIGKDTNPLKSTASPGRIVKDVRKKRGGKSHRTKRIYTEEQRRIMGNRLHNRF